MFVLQLILLASMGLIGIIGNWLLILAIQRKTFHYQHAHQFPTPANNKSLLRPQASISGQVLQAPLLPSVRSSISMFDKFILAFLINDIFVCNFLLPLRLLDLSVGLPCGFLCFLLKFVEKLATIVELIITSLLLASSLLFFSKNRLLTTKYWFLYFLLSIPILLAYLTSSLTYLDIDEHAYNNSISTCKQTYFYFTLNTQESLNLFCCAITYATILFNFALLFRMKSAIRAYQRHTLQTFTDATLLTRPETTTAEQVIPGETPLLVFSSIFCRF